MPRTPAFYSEDEVLIFSGQLADKVADDLRADKDIPRADIDTWDAARNIAADCIEVVMKGWDGAASVPLPEQLQERMVAEGERAIRAFFSTRGSAAVGRR